MSSLYTLQDKEIVDLQKRFWTKVKMPEQINDKLCWLWVGCKVKGYGTISFEGYPRQAHRASYWLYKDFVKSDLIYNPKFLICHKCDNKACINPSHLFKGTSLDNNHDMINKGRNFWMKRTHCAHGHKFTEENTYIHPNGHRICIACSRINDRSRFTKLDLL